MNLPKLTELLQSFYEISGMDIAIISPENKILARRYAGTRFCACIQKSERCLQVCLDSDANHLSCAKESGKLTIYKCPFGVYEALMPIKKHEKIIAYIFLGMGIEDNEESQNECLELALEASPNLNKEELKDCIATIPRHSKEKLGAFSALLPVLADSIEVNDLLSEDNVTIGQLTKRYIKSHLSQKITLSDIAGELHCSIVTVTENFKNEFGITVMEYVMQKRMQKAERLLENRELSVRDVSEACGFSSVECFSRNFKNKYGMSPRDWKNANA